MRWFLLALLMLGMGWFLYRPSPQLGPAPVEEPRRESMSHPPSPPASPKINSRAEAPAPAAKSEVAVIAPIQEALPLPPQNNPLAPPEKQDSEERAYRLRAEQAEPYLEKDEFLWRVGSGEGGHRIQPRLLEETAGIYEGAITFTLPSGNPHGEWRYGMRLVLNAGEAEVSTLNLREEYSSDQHQNKEQTFELKQSQMGTDDQKQMVNLSFPHLFKTHFYSNFGFKLPAHLPLNEKASLPLYWLEPGKPWVQHGTIELRHVQ